VRSQRAPRETRNRENAVKFSQQILDKTPSNRTFDRHQITLGARTAACMGLPMCERSCARRSGLEGGAYAQIRTSKALASGGVGHRRSGRKRNTE
jgi:hypothetical protein